MTTVPGLQLERFRVTGAAISLEEPDITEFAASIKDLYIARDLTRFVTTTQVCDHGGHLGVTHSGSAECLRILTQTLKESAVSCQCRLSPPGKV